MTLHAFVMLSMIGAAAAVDCHCEVVSQKADWHPGACPTGAHPCNAGTSLLFGV